MEIKSLEDYKAAYKDLCFKAFDTSDKEELLKLQAEMNELENQYPEFDKEYREWLLNQ